MQRRTQSRGESSASWAGSVRLGRGSGNGAGIAILPRTAVRKKSNFDAARFLAHPGLGKKIVELAKGTAVFAQGSTADAVFYVQKGRVKVTVVSKQGKEAVVALLAAGEFVGEECVASAQPTRLTTATAM